MLDEEMQGKAVGVMRAGGSYRKDLSEAAVSDDGC